MSDRIEEQRYQNAIVIRDLAKKKMLDTRRAKAFAERLSLVRVTKEKPIEKVRLKEETKTEEDLSEQKPEAPKRQSASPRSPSTPQRARNKESDSFLQLSAQLAAPKEKTSQEVAQIALPTLPSSFVAELVDRIQTHSNLQGNKFVTITFKGKVLSGAQVVVSVSQGKVRLRFEDTDREGRILLRNSKHALASRLSEKKLSLQDFEVH